MAFPDDVCCPKCEKIGLYRQRGYETDSGYLYRVDLRCGEEGCGALIVMFVVKQFVAEVRPWRGSVN